MSLLSPDTLSFFIAPDRIQAVKTVGLGQRAVEVHQRNATVGASDNWQGMTRVCLDLIQQTGVQRVRVVLSDKLVRYACFPWRHDLRTPQEDLSLARLNFDDVYGSGSSAEWHFAFSAGRPGQSRLSIALPHSLYRVLHGNFGLARPKVTSVQTAFSATLQTHNQKTGASGWLINLEEGRLTFGCWTKQAWSWIYSVHTEIDTPGELLERVQQEIKLASTSLKADQLLQIFVHAPIFEHLPLGQLAGVQFIQLKTRLPEPGPKYAFALMGAPA